jgi:hypothetical protein
MINVPTIDQLPALRKGLRKRKTPAIRPGMRGSFDSLGTFSVTKSSDTFLIAWQIKGGNEKSSNFNDLCVDAKLELDRLELGWLIAAMFDLEAQRIMDSIGHPIEAFNAASEPRKAAEDWRHWAKVKAGNMSNLNANISAERNTVETKSKKLGLDFLEINEEFGEGFPASLIDGPSVDLFQIAGYEWTSELNDAVWGNYNWKSLLEECDSVEIIETGRQDQVPGMSDVFFWVSIVDAKKFKKELFSVITASIKGE